MLLAVTAATMTTVGCASSGRASDTSAVADRFHAALQRGDG
jgi:hypothetical protein